MSENEFNSQQAVQSLIKKGARKYSCPICGGRNFSVQKQIATIGVSNNPHVAELGRYIPSAMMICTNCGYINFFALNILDDSLLSEKNEDEKK